MLDRFVVPFFLACAVLGIGAAGARADAECLKTRCEDNGRACVETLSAAYGACMAAGNRKCSGVAAAEKFNCLRQELSPCARTRNQEQDACLADMRSCHASCGPTQGRQVDYWCVGDVDKGMTAAFCAADPADALSVCAEALSGDGFQGSMSCEPL